MASSNSGYLPGLGQSELLPSKSTANPKSSSNPGPSNSSSNAPKPTSNNPAQSSAAALTPSSSRLREQVPGAELSSNEADATAGLKKKPRHRAGKKRRKRRESFAAPPEEEADEGMQRQRPSLLAVPERASQDARDSFYRLGRGQKGSATSMESEALLDHRDQGPLQARRQSLQHGSFVSRHGSLAPPRSNNHRQSSNAPYYGPASQSRSRLNRVQPVDESDDREDSDDQTPLLGSSNPNRPRSRSTHQGKHISYGGLVESPANLRRDPFYSHGGRRSAESSRSAGKRLDPYDRTRSEDRLDEYDVNNPPSMPSSPKFGAEMGYDDVMLTGADITRGRSPDRAGSRDALIDIDDQGHGSGSQHSGKGHLRRMTLNPVDDVCFPQEDMTEIGEDDYQQTENYARSRRRRAKVWPDIQILEEWAVEEKEQRTMEGIRARKVSEPLLVGGRLRPQKQMWHRDDDDVPLRFTYFNEDFHSTLHSQSLSELIQEGQTFRNLFMPEAPLLSDSESEAEDDFAPQRGPRGENGSARKAAPPSPEPVRNLSRSGGSSHMSPDRKSKSNENTNGGNTGRTTPMQNEVSSPAAPRYGTRPIWWLDVLSPTDAEMKVLSKAFSIHPLSAEDVMMQEAREKVELFRNYYFVNYRTFEQDTNSENYIEPINMYVVVFREGVISFHFSQTPHPANVRRRIRQLTDYLILTTDWISYAIIDDITDAYAPLAERIEEEVDDIDEAILGMHTADDKSLQPSRFNTKTPKWLDESSMEKSSNVGEQSPTIEAADMLRRVGECRKKVMSLYRLLGNKADVIKGFAKRCNEQWEIAPRSEIGLYLGDIQDHIVTMTGNLSHYENLLSRAHSNYLAQINIRMNERAEKTNDVLSNLTVLGTIVLPMNIITGMWGMNVLVPGQTIDSLWWFYGITAGLFIFGISCFFIAKRTYGIV